MATLIIPSAGHATRMKSELPKALTSVNGHSIIKRIIEKYRYFIEEVIVVIQSGHHEIFSEHFKDFELPIKFLFQVNPSGTADAVNIALSSAKSEIVIVIWGDHIGATFMPDDLISEGISLTENAIAAFPVIYKQNPYVYFKFSDSMSLQSFHETRKLEPMVDFGWNDCGVFFLNREKICEPLIEFLKLNRETKDLNFLNIFPWLSIRGETIAALKANDERLTLGVNSQDELELVSEVFKSIG